MPLVYVTVYFGVGLSSQIALTVVFAVIVIASPAFLLTAAAEPILTSQFKKCLPDGAVKIVPAGSVYSWPSTNSNGPYVPVPPLLSNVTSKTSASLSTTFTVA